MKPVRLHGMQVLALAAWLTSGCGADSALTTIELTIQHDRQALELDGLSISIQIEGEPWFGPEPLLESPREVQAIENLFMVLADSTDGQRLTIRVDGSYQGKPRATGQVDVTPLAGRQLRATVELAALSSCGDESCDTGEDGCTCPEDCVPNGCGDGICCADRGEDSDACPGDCPPCGDGDCDPAEDGCTCPEDCEPNGCGDGICCTARDEDTATCPADCLGCGDGFCGTDEGPGTCPGDCCPGLFGLNANLRREASPQAGLAELAALAAGTGARSVRAPLEWFLVQPNAPPAPLVWGIVDDEAGALQGAGLCTLRTLFGTPAWASTNPAGQPAHIFPPADPDDLAGFVQAAVGRYGHAGNARVSWWEFWSRPDQRGFFDTVDPDERLAAFTGLWQAADAAILGADPEAIRLSPSVTAAPQPVSAEFRSGLWTSAGAGTRFTTVTYQAAGWDVTGDLQRILGETAVAGLDDRPIWIGSTSSGPDGIRDDTDQARALVARHGLLFGESRRLFGPDRPGVRRVFWAELRDGNPNPVGEGHRGLLHRPGYAPKLAYYTYAHMVDTLDNADPDSVSVLADGTVNGTWAIRFDRPAPAILAFWWHPNRQVYLQRRTGDVARVVSLDVSSLAAERVRVRKAVPVFFGRDRFACFDGTDAGIHHDAAHGFDLDGASGTLSVWVRPDWSGDDGYFHDILEYQPNEDDFLRVQKNEGGRLRATFEASGIRDSLGTLVEDWRPGEWHLIEVEWDQAADIRRLWIDGELRSQESGAIPLPPGPGDLWVGTDNNGPAFEGCVDEVVLLSASRSDHPDAVVLAGIPLDGSSGIIRPEDSVPGPPGVETGVSYRDATPDPPWGAFDEHLVDVVEGSVQMTLGKTPLYLEAESN